MNESWVTLQGWVGGEVISKEVNGVPLSTFRLGCTPRYLKNGEWVDGPTSWYTINAWRGLAGNVAASVRKGDPVVVHGRLKAEAWERDGLPSSTSCSVDARVVGHDLTRGTSVFTRPGRPEQSPEPSPGQSPERSPDQGPEQSASQSLPEAQGGEVVAIG